MFVNVTYASPSALRSSRDRAELSVSGSVTRPVQFYGRVVQHGFLLRCALRALGGAIWSDDSWQSEDEFMSRVLDPIVTVHPDRLWFEAFSQDMSAYAALIVQPEVFAAEGQQVYGTTNIDFTAWLWGAIGEMRTSRSTYVRIGAEGLEVSTEGAGGRFEEKVEIPDAWVRGFLQVQGAMALPGTKLTVKPVDLLSAIRFLQTNKAKVSPRALRYEFNPGEFARLVLEPWDHVIPLRGAVHGYTEHRVIRTWGRRRLKLLEPLLPFAESVDIYLKGRSLPSFYSVKLPGMTFLLGLSGYSAGGFGGSSGFDLTAPTMDSMHSDIVLSALSKRVHANATQIAADTNLAVMEASRALNMLTYGGRAMFDVETREWRHRDLFNPPIDTAKFFPPDPRREQASQLQQEGVTDVQVDIEVQRKQRRFINPFTGEKTERELKFNQYRIRGSCGGESPTIVVNADERIVFGQCGCGFFKDNLLNQGPCAHMLALFAVSGEARTEKPLKKESKETNP